MVELRRESQWVLLLVTQPQAGIGSLVMRGNARPGRGTLTASASARVQRGINPGKAAAARDCRTIPCWHWKMMDRNRH